MQNGSGAYVTSSPTIMLLVLKNCNNTKGFIVDSDGYVVVYTDGACFNNGKPDAQAGISVWFDDEYYL